MSHPEIGDKQNVSYVNFLLDSKVQLDSMIYRKLVSYVFEEFKQVQENRKDSPELYADSIFISLGIDVELCDILAISNNTMSADDIDSLIVDEAIVLYGNFVGISAAINILGDKCSIFFHNRTAYNDNKEYAVLKATHDELVETLFRDVKRVQYTKGKISSMNFMELIQYGALLDIRDLLYKIRYKDGLRMSMPSKARIAE